MAEVIPRPSFNHLAMDPDQHTPDSPIYRPPEPNPPFVFPMQAERSDIAALPSHPDFGRGRIPLSRSRPPRIPVNPLPPFEFHSSNISAPPEKEGSSAGSPSKSISTHSSGHRRNGSEFIGGDGRSGIGFMNSSPTKGGETLLPPSASMTGPLASRRGHAHRRSDAISSHDLSFMLRPANEPRGSSAPTTPSDPDRHGSFPSENENASTQPVIPLAKQGTAISSNYQANVSFDGPSRPRVGFSETVEFIPRPLSTISSETSSSLSTIRPNHSLTGSITSIISSSTSSPPSSKVTRSSLDTMFEIDHSQPRPKTASPTLHESGTHSAFRDDLRLLKRPSSASSNHGGSAQLDEPVSWRYSGDDDQRKDGPALTPNSLEENSMFIDYVSTSELAEPQGPCQASSDSLILSMEPKRPKKPKKVSSWAGSILSRKSKHRDCKGQCAGHPPSAPHYSAFADGNDLSLENITFDEDTTCVIETPVDYHLGASSVYTEIPPWKPRESSPASDSDTAISVLDLDAALGPFNTPKLGGEGDDSGTSFFVSRRRMHSSGTTGGFTGPGMHYHRRAESAPEMVAINYQVFGFPRLSTNAAMADVFEEEEEEDEDMSPMEEGQQDDPADNDSIPGLGVNIVDIDNGADPLPSRPENTASSPDSEGLNEDFSAVEIVNTDEEPRASVVTKSSDGSTITPTLSNEPCIRRPSSAPIDFAVSRTHMFATPQSPSVSFPEFRSSSDVPRMHTANSSMTDRVTVGSDVPSLISNAPTMTSAHDSRFSSVGTHSSSDLPHSLPSHARPRISRYDTPSKRSSFASLSRLVGSSHGGEKSKLSIEERATPDSTDKTERKKGNRLSRLMRFWKSKEKLTS